MAEPQNKMGERNGPSPFRAKKLARIWNVLWVLLFIGLITLIFLGFGLNNLPFGFIGLALVIVSGIGLAWLPEEEEHEES